MADAPRTISFARGAPSLDIVDVEGLKEAAAAAFTQDPAGTTAYGTAVGYVPLREWIAARHGVDPAQVLVTNGSMQADAFLFETLVGDGDDVVVEKPTYDRTLLNLRSLGANVHAVSLEADGIDVDELEALLADGHVPKLAHVIPNFQNPAGYTLSGPKRERLVALAKRHGFVLFEDDPYVDIRFRGEPLPTMLSLDDSGSVVYASSFSKTVCPGIRVGYLVGPAALIDELRALATNTYISPNMVAQSIVHRFCVSGRLDRSIATVKAALAERVDVLTAGARARAARGALRRPRRRLLHVGRAARGDRRRRPLPRGPGAGRALREGHGLPARGRPQHAAPGLLRRDARRDRRGRHPPGLRGARRRGEHAGLAAWRSSSSRWPAGRRCSPRPGSASACWPRRCSSPPSTRQQAVGLLAALGLLVNALTLGAERRRPAPLAGDVRAILLAAPAGALLGVVVLRTLDALALQLLVSAAVVAALAARRAPRRGAVAAAPRRTGPPAARPAWSAPLAGLLAGGLGTSTSTSGPPLLLHLLGRGAHAGDRARHALGLLPRPRAC